MVIGGTVGMVLITRDATVLSVIGVSTSVLLDRRGTISHPSSFCVVIMALGGVLGLISNDRNTAVLCVAGVAQITSTLVSYGKYSTISYSPWFCVVGMAFMVLGWF